MVTITELSTELEKLRQILEVINQTFRQYLTDLFKSQKYTLLEIVNAVEEHGKGGIYAFFHPQTKDLIYIGQSYGIGKRINQHYTSERERFFNNIDRAIQRQPELADLLLPLKEQMDGIVVRYVIIDAEWERLSFEHVLIEMYAPPINEKR